MMLDLKNRPNVMGAAPTAPRSYRRRRVRQDCRLGSPVPQSQLQNRDPAYGVGRCLRGWVSEDRAAFLYGAAVIEIANREGRFLQQQATLADLPDDIERDITLAKSWSVAELVAQNLHLADDVEFDPPAKRSPFASTQPLVRRPTSTRMRCERARRSCP